MPAEATRSLEEQIRRMTPVAAAPDQRADMAPLFGCWTELRTFADSAARARRVRIRRHPELQAARP